MVSRVSIVGLISFLVAWPGIAQIPSATPDADFNGDGMVDSGDLLILMRQWHDNTGASANTLEIPLPNLPSGARPLRLARIPAGSFLMGSPDPERGRYADESPQHQVTIDYDFFLGETEVTQAQWQALMGYNASTHQPNGVPQFDENIYGVGDDYPVYHVSWDDITQADGFLDRLNALDQGTFRLPSEAEWEYSCRAGSGTRFYYGESLECEDDCQNCEAGGLTGNRSDYMWYCGNISPNTDKPVGGGLPNAFGLYDMHGNLFEWCQDWYHLSYVAAPTDGSAWLTDLDYDPYRVVRGGYWGGLARYCRSAFRFGGLPEESYHSIGLRVVRLP